MARRSPALLTLVAYAATLAWFVVAPHLPAVGGSGDANTILSDIPSLLLLVACTLCLLDGRDDLLALSLGLVAGLLLAGGLTVAEAGATGAIARVAFGAMLGMWLAKLLDDPAVVIGVPLFVAAIDIASVAGGPTALLTSQEPRAADFLLVRLPAIGGDRAGLIGVADFVFLAFFASHAWRFGLRRRATGIALAAAMPLAVVIQVALKTTIPVLPVLAAALLLPNLDLLPRLLERERFA